MWQKIQSKYILRNIFDFMKNRKKLNIVKYNKKILDKLDITKDDFQAYITLKKFNEKFNLNIRDIDIKELDLSEKNLVSRDLQYLKKIKFEDLQDLNLSNNKLTNCNVLEKVNFKQLKRLNISWNEIHDDIKILEKTKHKPYYILNYNYDF